MTPEENFPPIQPIPTLSRHQIEKLFHRLNEALAIRGLIGEIYVIGGAVMCLVLKARESTRDVDAVFEPRTVMRELVARIAEEEGLREDWLNDAAKGFLSPHAIFEPYLDLPNLHVLTASAEYLLAMKCLSCRLTIDSMDRDDLKFLLKHLNLKSEEEALAVIAKYYPLSGLQPKTHYLLQELLDDI